jgi:hypothetical protein
MHCHRCGPCRKHCFPASQLALWPLPSNGCCSVFVLWPLPSNGSVGHTAPSLRLIILDSLQTYRHFFSKGCVCDVCDWPRLPFPWLGSHGDYSPTAPTAPSLRPLNLSGSLIRCKPVQVYHHEPLSRVPLDPVYHIIYLGDNLVWASPWELEFGRFPLHKGWAIKPYSVALVVPHAAGQSVVTSFQSVNGRLQVLAGITEDVM